jgi:tRNA G46 methylase TrmB
MNKYILLSFSLYFSCNAMEENWHDQEPISDKQFEKITKNFAKEVLELKKEEDQLKQQENKWQHYDTHSKPQYEASLQNLKNFDLSKYKTILELGCNTGNVSAILAQQYPKINFIGIDPE